MVWCMDNESVPAGAAVVDLQAAYNLGSAVASAEAAGSVPPIRASATCGELWAAVMPGVRLTEFPTSAMVEVRAAFDRGRREFW